MVKHPWPLLEISLSQTFTEASHDKYDNYLPTYLPMKNAGIRRGV